MIGRFFDALLVYEHDTRHDHRLCFGARFGQTSFDEKFVDALAFHIGDITLECRKLSPLDSGLSPCGARDRARRVGQAKFGGAFVTQPDEDVWRIRPEERTYFSRHLHRIINTKSL